jgi:hypothetical protein
MDTDSDHGKPWEVEVQNGAVVEQFGFATEGEAREFYKFARGDEVAIHDLMRGETVTFKQGGMTPAFAALLKGVADDLVAIAEKFQTGDTDWEADWSTYALEAYGAVHKLWVEDLAGGKSLVRTPG